MAFKLTENDHKALDKLLGTLLDAYKNDDATKSEVIGAIAHVFTAGVIDNEGEVKAWLKPEQIAGWLDDLKGRRV